MSLSETMRRIPLIVERLLAASFVILLVRVLYFVLGNSAIEWPSEYREFAPVSFTGALLDGINPYAIEYEPHFTNVYGPRFVKNARTTSRAPDASVIGPAEGERTRRSRHVDMESVLVRDLGCD